MSIWGILAKNLNTFLFWIAFVSLKFWYIFLIFAAEHEKKKYFQGFLDKTQWIDVQTILLLKKKVNYKADHVMINFTK